jgi:hypothetical protein
VDLLASWEKLGRPSQSATTWGKSRWEVEFGRYGDFRTVPARVGRIELRSACSQAWRDPEAALFAMLLVLAWGNRGRGRGYLNARRLIASAKQSGRKLQEAVLSLRTRGALAGYTAFAAASKEIGGVGPPYATKLLHFSQAVDHQGFAALILDRLVSNWFARRCGTEIRSQTWSAPEYGRYLQMMHSWAATLKHRPEDLELVIFRDESRHQGNRWGEC